MLSTSRVILGFLVFLITFSSYAYHVTKGQFVSTFQQVNLSFKLPKTPNLNIDEMKQDVFVVNLRTSSYVSNPKQYVIVLVPLDERHYPNFKSYKNNDLYGSLKFRLNQMASRERGNLKNLKCGFVTTNKEKAGQCIANMIIPHIPQRNISVIGTMFVKNNQVVHVYELVPANQKFDLKSYNDLLNSVKVTIQR